MSDAVEVCCSSDALHFAACASSSPSPCRATRLKACAQSARCEACTSRRRPTLRPAPRRGRAACRCSSPRGAARATGTSGRRSRSLKQSRRSRRRGPATSGWAGARPRSSGPWKACRARRGRTSGFIRSSSISSRPSRRLAVRQPYGCMSSPAMSRSSPTRSRGTNAGADRGRGSIRDARDGHRCRDRRVMHEDARLA